jgi:hypothetical protein
LFDIHRADYSDGTQSFIQIHRDVFRRQPVAYRCSARLHDSSARRKQCDDGW